MQVSTEVNTRYMSQDAGPDRYLYLDAGGQPGRVPSIRSHRSLSSSPRVRVKDQTSRVAAGTNVENLQPPIR